MAKTLLLLGGSRYAIPVIDAAHTLGCEVVTADYLPDNYAHRFADRYENISIIDKEAVLDCARRVKADGVMSFAADPGVVSAAFAAEKLGLPFQSTYETTCVLQNKDQFRAFLLENGFNCPEARSYSSALEVRADAADLPYPVIVKPTDSAGSKGVSRVDGPSGLATAVEYAMGFSRSGQVIVEQFIEKLYPSSDSDGFTVDGSFECVSFTSQLFDGRADNPYAPAAYAMPSAMPEESLAVLNSDLQRLSTCLGLKSGIYNIETRIGTDGLPYIMEVSPRGGGNRLAEMLRFASGVDLITASIQAALGLPIEGVSQPCYDGYWYQQIVHADHAGIFRGIEYAPGFAAKYLVEEQFWVEPGSKVEEFTAANYAFGSVFLRFGTREELDCFVADPTRSLKTIVS